VASFHQGRGLFVISIAVGLYKVRISAVDERGYRGTMRIECGIKSFGFGAGECSVLNDDQCSEESVNAWSLLFPVQGYCNVAAFSVTCAGREGVDHPRHPTTPRPSPHIGPRCPSSCGDRHRLRQCRGNTGRLSRPIAGHLFQFCARSTQCGPSDVCDVA
jgi:hypothetical protein